MSSKDPKIWHWMALLVMVILTGGSVITFSNLLDAGYTVISTSSQSPYLVHAFDNYRVVAQNLTQSRCEGVVFSKFKILKEKTYNPKKYKDDGHLLREASQACTPPGTPRIAFLFLVRGHIPHEPLWKRYLQNHEGKYSLYVHAAPGYIYPKGSLFECKEIPSRPCPRFSPRIVDAHRRLLAQALLDPRYNNAWFVNVCESTIPIRSFPFAYHYLMTSPVSFVESFYPNANYHSWNTTPEFNRTDLRKGELWMAIRREHALTVVKDAEIHNKFLRDCKRWCTWDEQYVQTLLHIRDPSGIAERTVMYVDWNFPHGGSPKTLEATPHKIRDVQSRTRDMDGERHDTAFNKTSYDCVHNGVSPSPCFLFARKFKPEATKPLLALNPKYLGF